MENFFKRRSSVPFKCLSNKEKLAPCIIQWNLTVVPFSFSTVSVSVSSNKSKRCGKRFPRHLMGFERRMKLLKSLEPCQGADHISIIADLNSDLPLSF
ncbi:hypothetical protein AVEN_197537-1 [Araneus ventricosus]|uniref:Uncharacterized protein n=1 Tax=Araneus ventricosus TaxID=182803 RepID=A0A4Y2BRP4_ARAVE|nr:hypothetical protein AVEN_197537-1 [Araneus ventricosus]